MTNVCVFNFITICYFLLPTIFTTYYIQSLYVYRTFYVVIIVLQNINIKIEKN